MKVETILVALAWAVALAVLGALAAAFGADSRRNVGDEHRGGGVR
jgi:hypothetical protein